MIILDTNVLSALMQSAPEPRAVAWLDQQAPADVWLCAVTVLEARYGLAALPAGERKAKLLARFDTLLHEVLLDRVVPFDDAAARHAAQLAANRKQRGTVVDMRDTFIAGIATARRAAIATRNTRHFADLTVPVINPFLGPAGQNP